MEEEGEATRPIVVLSVAITGPPLATAEATTRRLTAVGCTEEEGEGEEEVLLVWATISNRPPPTLARPGGGTVTPGVVVVGVTGSAGGGVPSFIPIGTESGECWHQGWV